MSTTIMDDLKVLGEQIERLQIENRLLRAASEEQRELNGELRTKLQYQGQLINNLRRWMKWFDTWGILIDGSAYDEACENYMMSQELRYS